MYKLLLLLLMMGIWLWGGALQIDEEMAVQALFQGKHAVNRAVHAAAQQLDEAALAAGRFRIDEKRAAEEALRYLQANLRLDANGQPLPGSYWRDRVDVLAFEIVNADRTFPYTYRNKQYGYEVTLQRPGVVMIIRLQYPRIFSVLEPIEWEVKGAAELVYG
ncbi:hypothetical protein ABEV74_17120 [Paenibacillus cisolokensis]|uniref:hypothetical protein n=1 Tax=Paenibacillus cisolokensis TaxID=1658519 RepID=UPI003D29243A